MELDVLEQFLSRTRLYVVAEFSKIRFTLKELFFWLGVRGLGGGIIRFGPRLSLSIHPPKHIMLLTTPSLVKRSESLI